MAVIDRHSACAVGSQTGRIRRRTRELHVKRGHHDGIRAKREKSGACARPSNRYYQLDLSRPDRRANLKIHVQAAGTIFHAAIAAASHVFLEGRLAYCIGREAVTLEGNGLYRHPLGPEQS